jgi:hypothetical protein
MTHPVARPALAIVTRGPNSAQRQALRARLLQPMDSSTRTMIAAVATQGLDEIVRARLQAMGATRAPRRRKRTP